MARTSYGPGTKSVREDRGLIRYLMRHSHTSPFEGVVLKFYMRLPIFVERQISRHRTASQNQQSARYSVVEDNFWIPEPSEVAYQSRDNKQGRAEPLPTEDALAVSESYTGVARAAYDAYESALAVGVAREIARTTLPVSAYTEMYWQMNLHNLFHFLKLRLDPHAQKEFREYADRIAECAEAVAPVCYEAFRDYVLEGESMSRYELEMLRGLYAQGRVEKPEGMSESEYREFQAKMGVR
jgi:thymidylate synthase (FAD)